MKLIVGLGNPGKQYENTRHNVGFLVLDAIAAKEGFSGAESKFDGELRKGQLFNESCLFLKPLTYMNLSGRSVAPCMRFFKIDPKDVVVVHDEVDLEPGKVRARAGGGAGGHNGIRSMIAECGSADFHRIKVGVGKPVPGDVSAHVLGRMTKDELDQLDQVIINEVLTRLRSIFLQNKSES